MAYRGLQFQYDAPSLPQAANVNALLAPIMSGMDTYREGMNDKFKGDRALAQEAMDKERLQLAKTAAGRASESHNLAMEKARVERIAGIAQAIDGEQDPAKRQMLWGRLVQSHPNFAGTLKQYGIEAGDHVNGPKFLIAQARGYVDPTEAAKTQAQINLYNAQAAAANRREEPEIVRQLKAAGIDPNSAEGKSIILNSVKGGDPISREIAARLEAQRNGSAPQPSYPAGVTPPVRITPPAPSPVRPQSYAPEGEPQNLLTLTSGPEASAPAPVVPQEPMVDTPVGPMPRSQARLFGLGLAIQGKGEAGKMFSDPADPAKLGKEGQNNVEKEIIGRVQDLGELTDIKNQFDPKFLDLGNRVKQAGVGVQAWLNAKGVRPEDRADYERYTQFRAAVTERLNNRIKLMSGTAVSGAEEQRMLRANPNAGTGIFDGDDPISFEAKLNNAIRMQKLAVARFNFLRSKGIEEGQIAQLARDGKIEGVIGLDGMTKIMNDRGAQLEQQLRQSNPQADDTVIRGAVKQRLKQEFGI